MKEFNGAGVAMITPFNEDKSIDFDGLERLINSLIDGGINYLVSLGTTGETATLSSEEKRRIWAFTAKINNNRVSLVAGIGGNDTAEVAKALKNFNTSGYQAILSVSPYYSKPTQEGIYQHYKFLSDISPLPIILYNVPGRTGSNISAETTCRLAKDFKNIIGTKEASGNFEQFNAIMRDKPKDFLLISGDDPITVPMMAIGAVGLISVVGNALPAEISSMVKKCLDNQFTSATNIHLSLLEFSRLIFIDGNPAGVKSALKDLGVCGDTVRLPLVDITAETALLIKSELKKLRA